jgi:hypothetical protein
MIHDSERFQQLTSGLQNIVVTLAVLVGGIWTLYTFQTLKTREKAKLDLEIAEYRRAALDIAIKADYVDQSQDPASGKSRFIAATVTLTNRGVVHADINVSGESLIVQRFENSPEGPRPVERGGFQPLGVQGAGGVVRPNATAEYAYLIPVSGPGIYLLSFRATADERSTTDLKVDVAKPEITKVVWSADKIVIAAPPSSLPAGAQARSKPQ